MAHTDYAIWGGDLMLFLSGTTGTSQPLAFSTSASLSVSASMNSKASKDDGIWNNYFAGRRDWSISTEGLYNLGTTGSTHSINDLFAAFVAGTPLYIYFGKKTGTSPSWTLSTATDYYTGQAVIESLEMNAGLDEVATYSISLKGVGALTLV